jgi:hypothetical protein
MAILKQEAESNLDSASCFFLGPEDESLMVKHCSRHISLFTDLDSARSPLRLRRPKPASYEQTVRRD